MKTTALFEFIQEPLHTVYSCDAVIHISQLLHTVLLHVLQTLWVNSVSWARNFYLVHILHFTYALCR